MIKVDRIGKSRHVVLFALAALCIASCSPTKYKYYFSTYSVKPKEVSNQNDIHLSSTADSIAFVNHGHTIDQATNSEKKVALSTNSDTVKVADNKKKKRKSDKNNFKGDKSKNQIAEAGFAITIATPPIITIGAFVSRSTSVFFLAIPLAIIGITLNIIGLKSERRKLAKVGMWLWAIAVFGALVVFIGALTTGG